MFPAIESPKKTSKVTSPSSKGKKKKGGSSAKGIATTKESQPVDPKHARRNTAVVMAEEFSRSIFAEVDDYKMEGVKDLMKIKKAHKHN